MRRAGDTGIVVADRLLAQPAQAFVIHIQVALHHVAQVFLNRALVLRGRRDYLRLEDGPGGVHAIAVVEQPSWSLARSVAAAGSRVDLDRRGVRLLIPSMSRTASSHA